MSKKTWYIEFVHAGAYALFRDTRFVGVLMLTAMESQRVVAVLNNSPFAAKAGE